MMARRLISFILTAILVVPSLYSPTFSMRAGTRSNTSTSPDPFGWGTNRVSFISVCTSGCTGTWPHVYTITHYDQTSGAFSGTGVGLNDSATEVINGTVTPSGNLTLHSVYSGGGYSYDVTATRANDRTFSGTAISSQNQRFTVTLSPPKASAGSFVGSRNCGIVFNCNFVGLGYGPSLNVPCPSVEANCQPYRASGWNPLGPGGACGDYTSDGRTFTIGNCTSLRQSVATVVGASLPFDAYYVLDVDANTCGPFHFGIAWNLDLSTAHVFAWAGSGWHHYHYEGPYVSGNPSSIGISLDTECPTASFRNPTITINHPSHSGLPSRNCGIVFNCNFIGLGYGSSLNVPCPSVEAYCQPYSASGWDPLSSNGACGGYTNDGQTFTMGNCTALRQSISTVIGANLPFGAYYVLDIDANTCGPFHFGVAWNLDPSTAHAFVWAGPGWRHYHYEGPYTAGNPSSIAIALGAECSTASFRNPTITVGEGHRGGSHPAPTPSPSPTNSGPSPTPSPVPMKPIKAGTQYTIGATTGATIIPGSHDTGNRCDECVTRINLPFRYKFYNKIVTAAYASANGQLDFMGPGDRSYDSSGGLPDRLASDAIFPYWGDLTTAGSGGGIFTSLSADPRTGKPIFNIEWRARYVDSGNPVNFEIRLYASAPRFDLVYGRGDEGGSFATVGVQQGFGTSFTLYETYTPYSLAPRIALHFALNDVVPPMTTAHNALATSRTPNKSSATATSSLTNSSKDRSVLAHLHMSKTHHLQAEGKLTELRVYASPVGLPARSRLSMRNIRSVRAFDHRTTVGASFDLPISIAHYAVMPHRIHNILPDGATSIYGVSGDFADCHKSYANPVTCSNGHLSYSAAFGNQNTGDPTDAGTDGLGASLIRFQSFLPCTPSTLIPADRWNNTFTSLKEAYSRHLIPIVNFLPPNYVPPKKVRRTLISPGCPLTTIAPETWYNDVSSFAATLYSLQLTPQSGIPKTLPPTYFEIGNEPNDGQPSTEKRYGEPNGVSAGNYPNDFAQAARALTDELQSDGSGTSYPFYRILTAGVVAPSASKYYKDHNNHTHLCSNYEAIDTFAGAAIKAAKNIGVTHNLGVAVHPYGYVTQPDGQDWKNYIGLGQTPSGVVIKPGIGGRTYGSPCFNLEAMNRTWTSHFPGLPLVYTEINSSSGRGLHGDSTEKQGTYLIDLFSYMYRHHKSAVMHPSTDVYRILWYRGGDQGVNPADRGADSHGIYTVAYGKGTAGYLASDKSIFGSIRCRLDNISNIGNVSTMSNDFFFLRHAMC